jgi:two-component system, chemotaxis family, sensor kinase CheA
MSIDKSQFFQLFFEETEELLASLEKLLLSIDTENPDKEELNAIFRIAHSIKGNAATFGFTDLIDITHLMESMLDNMRHDEDRMSETHQKVLLQARDVLEMQLNGIRFESPVDVDQVANIRMILESMVDKDTLTAAPVVHSPYIKSNSSEPEHFNKKYLIGLPNVSDDDIRALTHELSLLGKLTSIDSDEGIHQFELLTNERDDEILSLCSFIVNPDSITLQESSSEHPTDTGSDVFPDPTNSAAALTSEEDLGYGFFEPLTPEEIQAQLVEKQAAQEKMAHSVPKEIVPNKAESSTIRVGIDKVDQLINLVGELVITQAMIAQRAEALDPVLHEKLLMGVNQLNQNTRDLQESVLSIRMMPMDFVFSRFPRMVHELSNNLGKKVNLVTEGDATELDKGLIEKIIDPLTHLVRNSIDHGIEKPDVRASQGKPTTGQLKLSAAHRGSHITIEISDDGAGLNRSKILDKARSNGLDVSDDMSDNDVWQLIFMPGFSTAESVTAVSGRGVGMDVVKRNIKNLGGNICIQTAPGLGTSITISLPLTLAILEGMSVKVGSEIYILPLSNIIESFRPVPSDIKDISGSGQVVQVRGSYLPILPMHQIFQIEPKATHPCQGILVILTHEGKNAALFVDELIGQQQIVVKNLESNYKKIQNISAATILGDGSVSLIVDIASMMQSEQADQQYFF